MQLKIGTATDHLTSKRGAVRGTDGPVRGNENPLIRTGPLLTAKKPFEYIRSFYGFSCRGLRGLLRKGKIFGLGRIYIVVMVAIVVFVFPLGAYVQTTTTIVICQGFLVMVIACVFFKTLPSLHKL